jgi:cytochrome c5
MVWRITLIVLGLSLSIAACGGKEGSETSPQPAPSSENAVHDGTALVQALCTTCHTTERIDTARYDRAGWEQTVDRMIKTGAHLTDAQRKAVVDYLAGR